MNGKNHLISGVAVGADAALAATYISRIFPAAGEFLADRLSPFARFSGTAGIACCAFAAGAYLFGTILPDVDNGGLVSRYLHLKLPCRHRGWTHSIWAMAAILAVSFFGSGSQYLGMAAWVCRYLALGMLAHDAMDGLSVAGWVMFYPFGRWRVYKGTVMKQGWTPGLYSSAQAGSESVVTCAIVVSSAAVWAFLAYVMFFT